LPFSVDLTNHITDKNDISLRWVLKENEKIHEHEHSKKITSEIHHLERLFHIGTANPRQKMIAEQMQIKLETLAQEDFSRRWKEAMALRSLEENLSENF
ncbi:12734_t:CDS:2, partial [Gigaspora rosea]